MNLGLRSPNPNAAEDIEHARTTLEKADEFLASIPARPWECDVHFCIDCGCCLFCDEDDDCGEDNEGHWFWPEGSRVAYRSHMFVPGWGGPVLEGSK